MKPSGPRVLLVDGREVFALTASALLEDEGYVVDVAGSVRAARAALQLGESDGVVLDVSLPDGSGLELVSEAPARLPRAHLVVASGSPGAVDTSSVDAVVPKGDDAGALAAALSSIGPRASEQVLAPEHPRGASALKAFAMFAPEQLAELLHAATAEDAVEPAHKLKGTALLLGLPRLAALCAALEAETRVWEPAALAEVSDAFEAASAALRALEGHAA